LISRSFPCPDFFTLLGYVYRRAIELVETQEWCRRRKQTNESSQAEPPSKPLRVTLSHIASVISEVYSSTVSSCSAQESIPLQQKLVACTLLLLVRSQPKKEVTLGKLHEAYTEVCRKRRLKFESETEFVGLCKMLDSTGIISLKKAKETRLMKVSIYHNVRRLRIWHLKLCVATTVLKMIVYLAKV